MLLKNHNVLGHSRWLFTCCRTCSSWRQNFSLSPPVLNGHCSITPAPMHTHMTQHLLTVGEQVIGIWSTKLHSVDDQSLVEEKRLRECPEEWISELVWLNLVLVSTIKILCNMNLIPRVPCIWIYMLSVCGIKIEACIESSALSLLSPVVHLEEYSAHDWPTATLVLHTAVIWPVIKTNNRNHLCYLLQFVVQNTSHTLGVQFWYCWNRPISNKTAWIPKP